MGAHYGIDIFWVTMPSPWLRPSWWYGK